MSWLALGGHCAEKFGPRDKNFSLLILCCSVSPCLDCKFKSFQISVVTLLFRNFDRLCKGLFRALTTTNSTFRNRFEIRMRCSIIVQLLVENATNTNITEHWHSQPNTEYQQYSEDQFCRNCYSVRSTEYQYWYSLDSGVQCSAGRGGNFLPMVTWLESSRGKFAGNGKIGAEKILLRKC